MNFKNKPTTTLPAKQRVKPITVDDYEFVKVWMRSTTIDQVYKHFGYHTHQQVYSKANSLRKKGVKLPQKQANVDRSSVDELNRLIARMSKK